MAFYKGHWPPTSVYISVFRTISKHLFSVPNTFVNYTLYGSLLHTLSLVGPLSNIY